MLRATSYFSSLIAGHTRQYMCLPYMLHLSYKHQRRDFIDAHWISMSGNNIKSCTHMPKATDTRTRFYTVVIHWPGCIARALSWTGGSSHLFPQISLTCLCSIWARQAPMCANVVRTNGQAHKVKQVQLTRAWNGVSTTQQRRTCTQC